MISFNLINYYFYFYLFFLNLLFSFLRVLDVEIPQPSIYKSSSLCFSYHVRRGTVPGCVLTTSNLKIENKKEEKENEKDSNKSKKKSKKRSREEDEVKNNENLDNDDDIQLISEKKRKTETFDLESEQSNASTMSTNINDTTTQSYVLENNYVGGKYLGFTITKYVLVVETLSKENASKQTTGIAQYFAVPTSTSSHTNNNNNNNNNSTSNSSNKPIEAEKPKRKNAKHNYLRK